MALFHYMVLYGSVQLTFFMFSFQRQDCVTDNNELFWCSLSQVSKQAEQVLYSEMAK